MRIILIGSPGAGKGTQAAQLIKAFQIPHAPTSRPVAFARPKKCSLAIAWFAVRQMFELLEPAERVELCEAVSIDLERAVAAGLAGPQALLGDTLRGVLDRVRARRGEIEGSGGDDARIPWRGTEPVAIEFRRDLFDRNSRHTVGTRREGAVAGAATPQA